MFRSGAGHDSVYSHLFHGVFLHFLMCGDGHLANHFLGIVVRSRKHFSDSFFCRQNNGQTVGPTVPQEQLMEICFSIRLQHARPFGLSGYFRILLSLG